MKEIEGIIDEPVLASLAQIRLQGREIGGAALRLHDHLAVDQGGADGQVLESGGERAAEFLRPVEAASGQQLDPSRVDAGLDSITVELDLVNPSTTPWGLADQGGQRRLDEAWKRSLPRALQPSGVRHARLRSVLLCRPFDFAGPGGPPRLLAGDLFHDATRLHRLRTLLENVRCVLRSRLVVVALDEEPGLMLLARIAAPSAAMPSAPPLFPLEPENQEAPCTALHA